jgi:hypothetical protein
MAWPNQEEQTDFRYKQRLAELIERINTNKDYKAICLLEQIAHGYKISYEVVQLNDDKLLIRSSGDFGEKAYSQLNTKLDLTVELVQLRQAQTMLKTSVPLIDMAQLGRPVALFIALHDAGTWLTCPPAATKVTDRLFNIIVDATKAF